MSGHPCTDDIPIRGYLSEASKRRFTIIAGLLGTGFLFGQFALPFALMAGFMVSSADTFDVDFARRSPHNAAIWDRGLWLVETESGLGEEPKSSMLVRTDIGDSSDLNAVTSLKNTPYLLAGDDRLWLISKKAFSYFQNGRHIHVEQPKMLADFSMPFLYKGRPAVVERWPNEFALLVHDGASWQPHGALPIVMPSAACGCGLEWAKAVADDRGVHLFLEFGTSLYYGLWNPDLENEPHWELAAETGDGWAPFFWNGEPAVLGVTSRDDGNRMVGTHLGADGWTQFLTFGSHHGDVVSAFNTSDPNRLIAAVGTSYSSSFRVFEIADANVVLDFWVGRQSDPFDHFPGFMVAVMASQYGAMFLFPLILAMILSALMRRHRVGVYRSGARSTNHASLTRRAIAQIVDFAITAAPVLATFGLFIRKTWSGKIDPPEGFWGTVTFLLPIIIAIGWAMLTTLAFTFSEGRWGITPGKWLTKIRVSGIDLQPCGFGRALIRNLLKCVDGFFNFVVGIMVAALSENWQRIGDMAARTVVVVAEPDTADLEQ